jgi:methyl-accepting chemotaxis protein
LAVEFRNRTLLIIASALIGLFILLTVSSTYLLSSSFGALEQKTARENTSRVMQAIQVEQKNLATKITDWAQWDDAYQFMEDKNQDFIDANFAPDTLSKMGLHVLVFLKPDGSLWYAPSSYRENGQEAALPALFQSALPAGHRLLVHPDDNAVHSGILLLPEGVLLTAYSAILHTNAEGPPQGLLVMGRYLDAAELKSIETTTNLAPITIAPQNQTLPSTDFADAAAQLTSPDAVFLRTLSESDIAGYALLYDLDSQPAAVVRVDMPRAIYDQEKSAILYLIAALFIASLLFGLITIALLNRITGRVARMLGEMARTARHITDTDLNNLMEAASAVASGDLTVQPIMRTALLEEKSGSEMIELTREYNRMISGLKKTGEAFLAMVAEMRALVEEAQHMAGGLQEASDQLATTAGQAESSTDRMTETLESVAQATQHQSETVQRTASSAEEISRAVQNLADGTREQSRAVAEAAEYSDRIHEAIAKVAAGATSGARNSDEASVAARTGAERAKENLAGMQSIRAQANTAAQKVEQMGDRAGQIGAIVETIDEIASQTNLLALNAAIEAARAGEHGKGFAVVADEVRKLAERTTAATREIAALVEGVQSTAAEAVASMSESTRLVDGGSAHATQVGRALTSILESNDSVFRQVQEISTASQEMSLMARSMVDSMTRVNAVVETNSIAAEQMANTSRQFSQAVDSIASVSSQTQAAIREINGAAQQMTTKATEVAQHSLTLSRLSQKLQQWAGKFKLTADERRRAPGRKPA